jgi:hypothetical protein
VPSFISEYAAAFQNGGAQMVTVTFRVPVMDAGRLMGEMRVWLDRRRVVPTAFHCDDMDGCVIEITFRKQADAAACAKEFEGVQLTVE